MTIELEVGDLLEYLGDDPNECDNLTVGKAYEVVELLDGEECADDDAIIIDDDGDTWLVGAESNNRYCFVLTTEEQVEEDLSSPSTAASLQLVGVVDGIKCGLGSTDDNVNSPSHYNSGAFETIDVIEHITQGYKDPMAAYCIGNVVKYVDRAPFKHETPIECLEKAAWYLAKAIESAKEEYNK